jgi:hypothetical protein
MPVRHGLQRGCTGVLRRSPGLPVATGLRRVDWVRLVVEHDTVRAEAVGVGHRLPVTRSIPLSVAAALLAGGIPSVTRRVGDGPDSLGARR